MSNEQIAHDLAVAKLRGSDLSAEELVKTYRQYYNEILAVLNAEPRQVKSAKVVKTRI